MKRLPQKGARMNRRDFLKRSIIYGGIAIFPSTSYAKRLEKRLPLYNIHTGESVYATFWANGKYIYDEIAEIEFILRDYRSNQVHSIDVSLLEYMYKLYSMVDAKREICIISGYRSPHTNAMLRRKNRGVAKRSLHMRGRAADIRIPGVELAFLKYAALLLYKGGVGYYPRSNFLHIDTGRPRYWRYPRR